MRSRKAKHFLLTLFPVIWDQSNVQNKGVSWLRKTPGLHSSKDRICVYFLAESPHNLLYLLRSPLSPKWAEIFMTEAALDDDETKKSLRHFNIFPWSRQFGLLSHTVLFYPLFPTVRANEWISFTTLEKSFSSVNTFQNIFLTLQREGKRIIIQYTEETAI